MKLKKSLLLCCLFGGLCFSSMCHGQQTTSQFSNSAIRQGDTVKITVYRLAEFNTTVRVGVTGEIFFTIGKPIQAIGLESYQIAQLLEKRLAENNVTDPHVDVYVEEWAPRQVYVMGEINNPESSINLPTSGSLNIIQALTMLGTKESALLTDVTILRKVNNQIQRLKVPLTEFYQNSETQIKILKNPEFILRPDDIIVIPKAQPVAVSGLVKSPGRYFIDTLNPPTISEMITQAGGLDSSANSDQIILIRPCEKPQSPQIISINYTAILNGDLKQNLTLIPGDSLIINPSKQIFVIGSVKTNGPLKLLPGQSITANRAIAMAGGFTTIAKKSSVILVRQGKIHQLNLSTTFSNEDNLKNDWLLEGGDIIYIKESLW